MPFFFGIVATESEIAAGTGRRREQTLRDCFPHRPEPRLHDALRDLRGAAGNRARIAGIEKGVVGRSNVDWRETTGIDRHVGKNVLHRDVDRGLRCRPYRVHWATAWRACPRQDEMDVGAGNWDVLQHLTRPNND